MFMGGSALPLIKIINHLFPDDERAPSPPAHATLKEKDSDYTRPKRASHTDSVASSGASRRSKRMVLSKTQEMNNFESHDSHADETGRSDNHSRRRTKEDREKHFLVRVSCRGTNCGCECAWKKRRKFFISAQREHHSTTFIKKFEQRGLLTLIRASIRHYLCFLAGAIGGQAKT